MATTECIIFEQPLNENMRMCLRLEYLFQQIKYHIDSKSQWDTRATVTAILELLQVIDRPDLKNKFGQALQQYSTTLGSLGKSPNIDKTKLAKTIQQIDNLAEKFHSNKGRIAQILRENEFLTLIQQRSNIPAGTCNFGLSSYHLWLQQPAETRERSLRAWIEQFGLLQETIQLLLKITRESTVFKSFDAPAGFYQANLDATVSYQMIRIEIPKNISAYPEISIGRHRITIHFFGLNQDGHSHQTQENVCFKLALCK